MKALKSVLFALALIVSGSAIARPPVPMTDVVDQPIATASGKSLTAEETQAAIRSAAESRKWVVTPISDGKIAASLSWNSNKHTIVVTITPTAERYSIAYKDSVNMHYGVRDGQPVIHPYYNRFVDELRDAIRVELMKF
jgi:hypothetical protein